MATRRDRQSIIAALVWRASRARRAAARGCIAPAAAAESCEPISEIRSVSRCVEEIAFDTVAVAVSVFLLRHTSFFPPTIIAPKFLRLPSRESVLVPSQSIPRFFQSPWLSQARLASTVTWKQRRRNPCATSPNSASGRLLAIQKRSSSGFRVGGFRVI